MTAPAARPHSSVRSGMDIAAEMQQRAELERAALAAKERELAALEAAQAAQAAAYAPPAAAYAPPPAAYAPPPAMPSVAAIGFVRKMEKNDTRKSDVVKVLVDAFANEVGQFSHCSSREEKRRKLMSYYFYDAEAAYALADRTVWGVEDKQKILGVSFWCMPGQSYISFSGLLKYTTPLPMTQYSPKNQVLLMKNASSMASIASKYKDTYILFDMAVDPSLQRCGVGTKMLMPVLTEAEQANKRCVAMVLTPNAIPFFKRFGFYEEEEKSLNFGLKLVVMVRLPGANGGGRS
eukprot:TRINITY_DN18575_c0_g1_i1.p1 TRINITY_DN18575_c0_g1~~TRINITY_DN18575_c0_g1_i1.p1  ORF type:complete len:292 (-),score=86.62 TRINITY_DN18575_c0_g1_i1:274-1149(-)